MTPHCFKLANGLDVVLVPLHSAPVVALEVWVGVGSGDETAEQAGLAHVHEHMLFKGTTGRGVGEIAGQVEAAGGEINARTSFDHTVYHIEMSSRYFRTGLDILADAMLQPAFDSQELMNELEVIREEIKRAEDTPAYRASQALFRTVYGEHPYGKPVLGTMEALDGYGREDVLSFYRRWYGPSNLTLVVVGDVEVESARLAIEQSFGAAPPQPAQTRPPVAEGSIQGPEVVILSGGVRECYLTLGAHIPGVTHPDTPAVDILSVLLGGVNSSRLDVEVKRELALVNAVGTFAYTPRVTGLFTLSATFQEGENINAERAVGAVLDVLFGVRRGLVSAAEVERARTVIGSHAVYEKQTMRGLAQKYGFYSSVTDELAFEAVYYERLARVTVDDVQRVARKYLQASNLAMVLLGPDDSSLGSLEPETARSWLVDADARASRRLGRTGPRPDDRGIVRADLDNGWRLIALDDPTIPLVSTWIAYPGGKRYETRENSGLSHLMAELLTRGTHGRSGEDIAQTIESLGGGLTGYAGHNTQGASASFLSGGAVDAFSLLAECLMEPSFDAAEFDREQQIVLEELHAQDDQLAHVAFRNLAAELYGAHPYGLRFVGEADSVATLTSSMLLDAHRARISSDMRAIAIVGDMRVSVAIDLAMELLSIPCQQDPPRVLPPPPAASEPRVVIHREERNQAHLAVGFVGTTFDTTDRYALDVIAALLSGQGGRLFLELRDRQSLAYSVGASHRPNFDGGHFSVYLGTSPEKVEAALRGIGTELSRISTELVAERDLERACSYLVGAHDISMQPGLTRASLFALNELYGLGYGHHWAYASKVLAVTPEDVRGAAARFLSTETAVISAVLPPDLELDIAALLQG